jgi:glycosyltransferase involved in cell wall biosynthesis
MSLGGLEMNHVRNATWMAERGHTVFVFCLKDSPIENMAMKSNLNVIHIQKHRKYYDFSKGRTLASLLKKHQISFLFIRDTRDMSIAASAKFFSAKDSFKLVYFMEMQLGVKKTNFLHSIRFRFIDAWSCPLQWLEKQVHTMTHLNPSKTHIIPSGVDLKPFQRELSKEEARKIMDLPNEKIILGLIGRFDTHKGQLLVLEAFKQLKNKNLCICFLGEPTRNEGLDYYHQMTQQISENQWEMNVFIRPFRSDIEVFYKAIDACIMASKAETVGMVTLESLACGTPVIGSNAGGTPEILQHGKWGVLFESLNPKDLAIKIDYFLQNHSQWIESDLKKEAEKYSHHLVSEKVEALLEKLN